MTQTKPTHSLPERPSFASLQYQAKQLLKSHKARDAGCCTTLRCHPRFADHSDEDILNSGIKLADAQHALACAYGFANWATLKLHVDASARFDLETFNTVGYVKLPGVVSKDTVARMVDRVWQMLGKRGIERDDPRTWPDDSQAFRGVKYVSKLKQLRDGDGVSPEDAEPVREALQTIFEGHRCKVRHWGQALVTMPLMHGEWQVPTNVWHFDHSYTRPGQITGVNVFLLMDDVIPRGGGTAVVRNSPLLMDRLLPQNASFAKLSDQNSWFRKAHPWLSGLKTSADVFDDARTRAYLEGTEIAGVEVRVDEMVGNAGDVFISHPALLHAPAMNVTEQPRMMRTQRVFSTVSGPFAARR